jgi:hypothetical protein
LGTRKAARLAQDEEDEKYLELASGDFAGKLYGVFYGVIVLLDWACN